MRIYTKAGDDGSTGLFLGSRVSKADVLLDACGDLDEAVSALGLARALCGPGLGHEPGHEPGHGGESGSAPRDGLAGPAELAEIVLGLQKDLFVVAADLATNPAHRDRLKPGISCVTPQMVAALEALVDDLVARRPLRPVFVVPGANALSAALDHGRTVVRRAERHVVAAGGAGHDVSPLVLEYVNRASDLVFVLARHAAGEVDEPPSHD